MPLYVPPGLLTSYNAVISPAAGSGFVAGAMVSSFTRISPSLIFVSIDGIITTNGTGSSSLQITLPTTATAVSFIGGRESGVSFALVQGFVQVGSNILTVLKYDNSYIGANGARFLMSGVYSG